jgi:acetyl-CoA carboxylase carboxyltransferase component
VGSRHQKVVRAVDLAETFHLPVVYLMDCPGFSIGLDAEKRRQSVMARARDGGSQSDHGAAWCTIIVRNSFGVAGVVHQPAGRFSCVMHGHRPAGDRCCSKAALRLLSRGY